jgi:hypothetical protein
MHRDFRIHRIQRGPAVLANGAAYGPASHPDPTQGRRLHLENSSVHLFHINLTNRVPSLDGILTGNSQANLYPFRNARCNVAQGAARWPICMTERICHAVMVISPSRCREKVNQENVLNEVVTSSSRCREKVNYSKMRVI